MGKISKNFFRKKGKPSKIQNNGTLPLFEVKKRAQFGEAVPAPAVLDNNRNNRSVVFSDEQKKRIASAQKFTHKISWKCREGHLQRIQIRKFIKDQTGYDLPYNGRDWRKSPEQKEFRAMYPELENLEKYFYALGISQIGVFAKFDQNDKSKLLNVCNLYSKHRLDPVWNFRKSQIVRSAYFKWIRESKVFENYRALHLTLTVPHNPNYKGKEFYLSELLLDFNKMRKTDFWKDTVRGGEYGAEITAKNFDTNGLHIHLHSLIFVDFDTDLQELKQKIQKFWFGRTGGKSVGLTDLYFYAKKDGQYIYEKKAATTFKNNHGQIISLPERTVKKRSYCTDSDPLFSKMSETEKHEARTKGVLECIKYHFKPGDFFDEQKNLKFPMLIAVLNQSKGNRFYSRFGFLKDVELLNFNKKCEKPGTIEAWPTAAAEEDLGSGFLDTLETTDNQQVNEDLHISGKLQNLKIMNPFDGKEQKISELKLYLGNNAFIWYDKNTGYSKSHNEFFEIKKEIMLYTVINRMILGGIGDILTEPEVERFKTFKLNFYN